MENSIGVRIKQARKDKSWKQKGLADAMLGHVPDISDWENNKNTPTLKNIRKLAICLGVSESWLISGKDPAKTLTSPEEVGGFSNVYAVSGAGPGFELVEHESITRVWVPGPLYKEWHRPVIVRGRSMEPIIRDGAIAGVDVRDKAVVGGEIYAVHIQDEGMTIKRLFYEVGKIVVRPDNKQFQEFTISEVNSHEFTVLGRIKWVLQAI